MYNEDNNNTKANNSNNDEDDDNNNVYARGGGENVPGIPGACTTRNFTYVVRDPLPHVSPWYIFI